MTGQNEYLKKANTSTIAGAVRTHGPLALAHGGLTEYEIAAIAAKAITELDEANTGLLTFLTGSVRSDDSYESFTWSYEQCGETNMARLVRITTKREILGGGRERRDGMLINLDHAEAMVAFLNSLDWGTPKPL